MKTEVRDQERIGKWCEQLESFMLSREWSSGDQILTLLTVFAARAFDHVRADPASKTEILHMMDNVRNAIVSGKLDDEENS